MKKKLTLFCSIVIMSILLTSCTSAQLPQDIVTSNIAYNLFYEYGDSTEYKTKNLRMENGVIRESKEEWERGFSEAIPINPIENLAQTLGFKDYVELQKTYGQLYQYKNYPIGKVYTFFGNYNGTNDYTIFIWNDSGVHKIELANTNYFFRDLQLNDNNLYLIISEYPEGEDELKDSVFVYEIELNGYTYKKYTLTFKSDISLNCNNFLIKNKKLYLINTINITETTADSILEVIDLITYKNFSLKRNGLAQVSLFSTKDMIAVIYGKIKDGSAALPPYIEYYDEKLNMIDSKTLNINDENYFLYLGDFQFQGDNMYLVLKSKINRNCLLIIYNMKTNESGYKVEVKPPVKNAIMQKITYFIKDNGEYFNLP